MLVPLMQEQKDTDGGLKYYNNDFDILYANLPVHIFKAFISASKIKPIDSNGGETYYIFNQLRKYKDEILYGAKRAKYALTPQFKQELKVFIDSLKKELAKSKKRGKSRWTRGWPHNLSTLSRNLQDSNQNGKWIFVAFHRIAMELYGSVNQY